MRGKSLVLKIAKWKAVKNLWRKKAEINVDRKRDLRSVNCIEKKRFTVKRIKLNINNWFWRKK